MATRKKIITASSASRLTATRVPFTDANGDLVDDADLTFVTDTLTVTKIGQTTFTAFPLTPSAAPDANYEVANKKYVDDTAGGVAVGSANEKLFTDAAGTGLDWDFGRYCGSFTRGMTTASGDVSYTGVGFKPSSIIFIYFLDGGSFGQGVDDGTTHKTAYVYGVPLTGYSNVVNHSIGLYTSAGTDGQKGYIKTWDSDGFTITWTKINSPTGTGEIYYMAYR
jgi:hypothetical protein